MYNSYDVYVGNLSTTISRERLRNLFSEVGKILSIWINQKHEKFTYGFIAFYHLIDAKKACEQFNNRNLDGFVIKVNLSRKTEQKLNNSVRMKNDTTLLKPKRTGILLELPKRTGKKIPTKEDTIRKILRNTLLTNEEIVKDFPKAYFEAQNICSNKFEMIKTAPETPTLETLETTIKRYFNPAKKNTLFKEIDFDISKGNVLTTEQNDKFFNLSVFEKKTVKYN